MTTFLLPRLDALSVDQCLQDIDRLIDHARLPLTVDRLPATTGWGAIGGAQITLPELRGVRETVLEAARSCGFPERGSTADRARFDVVATAALSGCSCLEGGEADRDDAWAFIATILLPDVVAWRFTGRSAERFHGGVRNTFQRLWMRCWALDRGPERGAERWQLVEQLTEDALVQLTERPSIGSDSRLARAIAEAWVATAEQVGRARMEAVMRIAIIDLRIRNEIQFLSALAMDELQQHVSFIFARAAGLEVTEPPVSRPISESTEGLPEIAPIEPVPPSPDPARASMEETRGPVHANGDGSIGEQTIQHEILRLMLDGNTWSNGQLKDRLGNTLPFSDADRGKGARPGEELWENRVNNALGRARGSSLYAKGLVESCGHGLHRITASGIDHFRSQDGVQSASTWQASVTPPS